MKAAAADTGQQRTGGHIAFLSRLDAFLDARRRVSEPCGLVIVQLSNLQRINTTAGYSAGQLLTRNFAAALRGILRERDWLMVLSDDRFAVVLDGIRNAGHLVLAANRFSTIATELALPDGAAAGLETQAGAALYPQHGNSAELLLRHSELAAEAARREQSSFAVYRPEDSRELTEDWDLETELRAGLENSEFYMCYQPQIDVRSMLPCGAEALLRWENPRCGPVSPERFIAVAERSEVIDAISKFTLHSAARDIGEWRSDPHKLTVAINLSPGTIEVGSVLSNFERVAAIWGTELDRFTAEVTENGIISTGGAALAVLQTLRDAGIRVSIDDFGTGNSSLAYFKDIPADEVKIDKSFIMAMLDNDANSKLVRSIIDLAHGFDLQVVAEGVETAECVDALRDFGCDILQGYYFSRPLRQQDFIEYLQSARASAASSPA